MTRSGITLLYWKALYYFLQVCFWKIAVELRICSNPLHPPDKSNSCPRASHMGISWSTPNLKCSIIYILQYLHKKKPLF